MQITIDKAKVDIDKLKQENENLYNVIEKISPQRNFEDKGKCITEVGKRQQERKLKTLETRVEQALWFSESFGLKLDTVKLVDHLGNPYSLSFGEKGRKSYKDLPTEEQQKIQETLHIMDKFCISDASYHELSCCPGGDELPRSYLIKQCKEGLNKLIYIERTPGEANGAALNFQDELRVVIEGMIQADETLKDAHFKVKISGDGAKMTRLTNFIIISFSILNAEDTVMSSKGNHTVAVIKGHEDYALLKESCSKIFDDINKLASSGKIKIKDKDVPIEIFVGGNYKFLLLILGLKGATSDYACIWCKIHKLLRWDMSKTMAYWETHDCHSLKDIKDCALKNKFSCQHQPLLEVKLENVVLDELHLMLRITGDHYLSPKECGVSFNVWEKWNADGKGSGVHDFTSLMGSDKKLLMKHLPDKLNGVIKPKNCDSVVKIWKDFDKIYRMMNECDPSPDRIEEFFELASAWGKLFVSLGGEVSGFGKQHVTPYMHCLVYHVPNFMLRHNGI
ncbi:Hypothetical predicted protein [Paramuricea clavata]|uniref:Uncharacterized protein n=1 Tax=Paramuricea clavata TaxID=317549 RepID=A0A7D9EDD6_PARCT|nr:Hypothetical predicted protein [Paramuricea clavata]